MMFKAAVKNQERLLFVCVQIFALCIFCLYLQHVRMQYDAQSFIRIVHDIGVIDDYKKTANIKDEAYDLIGKKFLIRKIGDLYFYYLYVEKTTVNKNRFCKVYDAHAQLFESALESFEIPDLVRKISFDCGNR
jgi:hypothetical protein